MAGGVQIGVRLKLKDRTNSPPDTGQHRHNFQLEQPRPSFPWCFCFLGVFVRGNFLGLFECFLLVLQGF